MMVQNRNTKCRNIKYIATTYRVTGLLCVSRLHFLFFSFLFFCFITPSSNPTQCAHPVQPIHHLKERTQYKIPNLALKLKPAQPSPNNPVYTKPSSQTCTSCHHSPSTDGPPPSPSPYPTDRSSGCRIEPPRRHRRAPSRSSQRKRARCRTRRMCMFPIERCGIRRRRRRFWG